MAGFSVGGLKPKTSAQRQDGEESYNPLTGATSYWSKDRGDYVDKGMLNALQTGGATADPANNRIVMNPTPTYSGGGGGGTSMQRQPAPSAAPSGNNSAMLAKLDDLWNRPVERYSPVQTPQETGINPADEAYVAGSKERIGNMMRSGIDFLNTDFNRRGFGTDSRMQAGALQALTRGAMGEFATGEREMVQQRQDRNRNITDNNASMAMTSRRDNQSAAMQSQDRLGRLLSFYGMMY